MAKVIDWADIRPGMAICIEHRPEDGKYPPSWSARYLAMSFPLEPRYIKEVLPDGRLAYEIDWWDSVEHGKLTRGGSDVRYWLGSPTWAERSQTPWPEAV